MKLALFDFDGTVTTRDSFKPFLYFSAGPIRTALGTAVLGPVLAAHRLGVLSTSRLRQAGAYVCFRGRRAEEIDDLGARYSTTLDAFVRPEMLEAIRSHQTRGHEVAIVSASIAPYLRPWCERTGVERISTELEVREGVLTGCYAGTDCTGPEKARRVRARFELSKYEQIYAYGDTPEDAELLALAHRRFFRGREIT
jgi:HAD superfamily hydrolase (TIGR01490 family)